MFQGYRCESGIAIFAWGLTALTVPFTLQFVNHFFKYFMHFFSGARTKCSGRRLYQYNENDFSI